jgi:hypothetical protein
MARKMFDQKCFCKSALRNCDLEQWAYGCNHGGVGRLKQLAMVYGRSLCAVSEKEEKQDVFARLSAYFT